MPDFERRKEMLASALFIIVGVLIEAPTWYFIVLGLYFLIAAIALAAKRAS